MKKLLPLRNLMLHCRNNGFSSSTTITPSTRLSLLSSSSIAVGKKTSIVVVGSSSSSGLSSCCSSSTSNRSSSWFNHQQQANLTILLKQPEEDVKLSKEEKLELYNNYQFLDNTYKQITKFITQYRTNNPDKPFDVGLFDEILKLIALCHDTVPRVDPSSSTNSKFYNSSIGMKTYVLMKKVEYLLLKAVNQEWFSLEELRRAFNPEQTSVEPFKFMYPPEAKVDETLLLFSTYEAQLSNTAFVPQINNGSSRNLSTRESLIASCFFIFFRLRGGPGDLNELSNYADLLSADYETTKAAYTNSKKVSEDNNTEELLESNAHNNAFSYLERTFTEDEFDWFEDIETDMPIHMGNFIRAIKTTANFNANFDTIDKNLVLDTLEECINLEPENIYIHYMYAYCITATSQNMDYAVDREQAHANYLKAVSHLEKALHIMSTLPMLPYQSTLSKNQFSEVQTEEEEESGSIERINDLKFTPISLLLAHVYAKVAQSADSVESSQMYGNNGLYYSKQAELYSRHPNIPVLYMNQGICYSSCGMYESAIEAYGTVDQFDFDMHRDVVINSFFGASNCMVDLGLADKCLETIDIYVEKYRRDPRVILQKLLCKTVLVKSKDELPALFKEFKEFKEHLDTSLKVTDPPVYNFVVYQLESMENLAKARVESPSLDI